MNNIKTWAVAAALCGLTLGASALTVSAGGLSRTVGDDVIFDSVNQRQWLGADVTKGLTYTQTLAELASGGRFAGYQIARSADALMFIGTLWGSSNTGCNSDGTRYIQCSGQNVGNLSAVFGDSYSTNSNGGYNYDYMWFLTDTTSYWDGSPMAGIAYITEYPDYYSGTRQQSAYASDWSSIQDTQYYSQGNNAIGWLLFREGNAVPEPGTLALAGLAVAGVVFTRRRRAAASAAG